MPALIFPAVEISRRPSAAPPSNLVRIVETAVSFVQKCKDFIEHSPNYQSSSSKENVSFPPFSLYFSELILSPPCKPIRIANIYNELGVWLFNNGEFAKCAPMMKNAAALYKCTQSISQERKCQIIRLKCQSQIARVDAEFRSIEEEFRSINSTIDEKNKEFYLFEYGMFHIKYLNYLRDHSENRSDLSRRGRLAMEIWENLDVKSMKSDKFNSLYDGMMRILSFSRLFELIDLMNFTAEKMKNFLRRALDQRGNEKNLNGKLLIAMVLEANSEWKMGNINEANEKFISSFEFFRDSVPADSISLISLERSNSNKTSLTSFPVPIDFLHDSPEIQQSYFLFFQFLFFTSRFSSFSPLISHFHGLFLDYLVLEDESESTRSRSPAHYQFLYSIHEFLSYYYKFVDLRISLVQFHEFSAYREIYRLFKAIIKVNQNNNNSSNNNSNNSSTAPHVSSSSSPDSQLSADELELSLISSKYSDSSISVIRSESKQNYSILFDYLTILSSIAQSQERIGHYSESKCYSLILQTVSNSIENHYFSYSSRLFFTKLQERAKKLSNDFSIEMEKILKEIEEFSTKVGVEKEFSWIFLRLSALIDLGDFLRIRGNFSEADKFYGLATEILSSSPPSDGIKFLLSLVENRRLSL